MAVQPQLQWSLDKTAEDVFTVARGILEATTRDNVQALPLMACEKFGATLAISNDTYNRVVRTVLPTPRRAAVRFLQAVVGYYEDDCAAVLGKNRAGIQFLGLACALVTTIPTFEGATALEAMLRSTATDMSLVPSTPQLKELLLSLEPRCCRSGFADGVVRYQVSIGQAIFESRNDTRAYGRELAMVPSPDSIQKLVDAFRELGRVGESTTFGAEVTVITCAPWVAAFTEWCLGVPSIYFEDEERVRKPIIEQLGSKVNIIIPEAAPDSALQLKFPIPRGGELMGMVSIEAYGKWLLYEYGFDRGPGSRVLHSALPHAISKVLSSLTFPNFATAQEWPDGGGSDENIGRVSDRLLDLCPRPFPDSRTIANIYTRMLNIEMAPEIRSRGNSLLIADFPETKEYLELLQKHCACDACRSRYRDMLDQSSITTCEKNIFFYRIAKVIADILTLSLFHLPETLLVNIDRHRYGQKREGFVSDIIAILRFGNESECDAREILSSARIILGHQDLNKELKDFQSDWILTCYKGQAVYPAVFDSSYYFGKKGYLLLLWLPGILQYRGQKWKGVVGGQTTWGPDQPEKVSPEEGLFPQNLFRNLTTEWAVCTKDNGILEAKLLLKDGKRVSQTSRNPIDSLLGLQYGLVAEECEDSRDAKLKEPDPFCVYVGPEALPRFRQSGSVIIVPVDGADDLRFFSLPGAEEQRNFVLRKNACLFCCLKVCRRTGISVLIL